jgi:hypothetical protein
MRHADAERYDRSYQPTPEMIAHLRYILGANPLWMQYKSWAANPSTPTARLVLRWEGSWTSVRAFTFVPTVSMPGPRSVYVTRDDDDYACRMRADHPAYALFSWPALFPHGRALGLRPQGDPATWSPRCEWDPFEPASSWAESDGALDRGAFLSAATLAIAYQPERRQPYGVGARGVPPPFVMVPTVSPYDDRVRIRRPFSRVELAGRLGEEFILDRWLSRQDARRWQLLKLQRHLRGLTMTALERAELEQACPCFPNLNSLDSQ